MVCFATHFFRAPGRLLIAARLLGLAGPPAACAQGWTGLAHSNYAGTNTAYVNPSAITDARASFYLNLVGGGVNFYNDYLQLDLLQRPWQKDFSFKKKYLRERLNGAPKAGSASAEVRLPSLLVALEPRAALAFTNCGRAFVQASNVSESLARLAHYGLGDADRLGLANQLPEDNRFNLHVDSYHEFALSTPEPSRPTRSTFSGAASR